ncbi:MAG: winged helix-turn-helix transcriptional regulator [Rhodospirillaceae bacterium]|nr:winged helix-turn-helix transcriptional regulator [Rhodospirillales bacterium]
MLDFFETVAKAIADPTRIRILKLLEGGETCVGQITTVLDLAPATVSKHLAALRAAGLLQQRRHGKWKYYRLAERELNPYAHQFLALIRKAMTDDPIIIEDGILLTRTALSSRACPPNVEQMAGDTVANNVRWL